MSEYANEHYKKQKIDTVARFKANHNLQDQIAVCEFMIDKYNTRDKGQSLDDIKKIRYYANWKEECYKQIDKNKIKKTSPSDDALDAIAYTLKASRKSEPTKKYKTFFDWIKEENKPLLAIGDRFEVVHNDYLSIRSGDIVQIKELDAESARLFSTSGNMITARLETLSNSSKFKKLP